MLSFFNAGARGCGSAKAQEGSFAPTVPPCHALALHDLIPWQELEPVPGAAPGTWRATGVDPQFRAVCHIPAGWVRIRLQMSCDDRARVELLADTGRGFNASECLERIGFRGSLERDFFAKVPQALVGFRLDPKDADGTFRLERFDIRPVSRPALLGHALWAALTSIGGERRGVSPMCSMPNTSGSRLDARPGVLQDSSNSSFSMCPGPPRWRRLLTIHTRLTRNGGSDGN